MCSWIAKGEKSHVMPVLLKQHSKPGLTLETLQKFVMESVTLLAAIIGGLPKYRCLSAINFARLFLLIRCIKAFPVVVLAMQKLRTTLGGKKEQTNKRNIL